MWCNYITTISTRGCAVVFPNHFSKRILCNTWKLLHSHLFCCDSPPSCCVRTWSSVSPPSFLTDRRQPFKFCRRGSQSDRSSAHRGARPGLQFVKGEDRCRATVSTVVSLFTWVKSPPPSHQVNQSLSKLYVHVQAYRLYVGWLKEGQENASLSSKAAQHVNTHLRHLSDLLSSSLQQVRKQKQCRTLHKKDSPENKNKKMSTYSRNFEFYYCEKGSTSWGLGAQRFVFNHKTSTSFLTKLWLLSRNFNFNLKLSILISKLNFFLVVALILFRKKIRATTRQFI